MTLALITGGSGHAGAALQRELLNQGYKVRCIDFDKDHRAYEGLEVDLIEGDVTKKDTLWKIFEGVDVVFHTAAFICLDRRYKDLIRNVNVVGTENVCDVALQSGIKKMIHFSSVDAFNRFPIDKPLLEDKELVIDKNAIPYDLSKADAQRVVLDYCNNGLEASIIHPVNIFGPYDYKVGLGTEGLLDLANRKTPRLPNWGYNYVDVRDLSKTAISAIEKGRNGQNYLVAGEYRSFIELGQMIGEALGKDIVKGSIPGFLAYLLVPFSYINSVRNGKPSTRTLDTIHTGKTGNKLVPSTLAREELNHNPRPIMETVIDFVKFYSDRGLIKI
jgi:dihydroflavonol-4-reductase